ncbi:MULTISPECIES: SRPBCC family protein [unclassified Devosia]|uniref:SRPBCC family protein n=1 Tax=unclassified Devosia TaxID=196773 RepID=UPI0015582316|nr:MULTISPECIES: SRPBCC family protein [unclassified Devosia]
MAFNDELGVFTRQTDHIDVRFERHYDRPVETVWSAITEPERLADWMGAAYVEPHVGGRFELMVGGPHPMTGIVCAWEPPHLLEFSWSNTHAPDSVVRYELSREGNGTRLIFTHRGMPYVNSALMLPGWHDFLDHLESLLSGATEGVDPNGWQRRQELYIQHYDLQGVRLQP